MKVVLYGRRMPGLLAVYFLASQCYDVKVITDDVFIMEAANRFNFPVVELDTMGDFDVFLCVHGNRIVPMEYLQGKIAVNVHPCLSLGYKGHNPVKRYIANKNKVATIDAHIMEEKADEGEIIASETFRTGVVDSYASFYNIAPPYYISLFHKIFDKINNK